MQLLFEAARQLIKVIKIYKSGQMLPMLKFEAIKVNAHHELIPELVFIFLLSKNLF